MATDENVVSEVTDTDAAKQTTPSDSQDTAQTRQQTGESKDASKDTELLEQKVEVNPEVESIRQQLAEAEEKAAKHWDDLLRTKAEHENTRKRMQRDVENAHKFALEKFVQDLLPVIDSLEMGINAAKETEADTNKLKEGIELTLKMFTDCANKFGVEVIDPQGQPFNPEFHQAMSIQETSDHAPDTIIAVMQKGYLLNGRLVRPAMVVVAKAAAGESQAASEQETGKAGAGGGNNEKQSENTRK